MTDKQHKRTGAGTVWRTALLTLLFAVCAAEVVSQGSAKSQPAKAQGKNASLEIAARQDASAEHSRPSAQAQLKLVDGTSLSVDDVRENEQGIWYQQRGVTYLIPRERVKTIERVSNAKPIAKPEIAQVTVASSPEKLLPGRPVWIYLTGGARVEADSATESSAGVWYR